MAVDIFHDLADFTAAERQAGRPPDARPFFQSPAWFACLAQHTLAPGTRIRIYRGQPDETGCALACKVPPAGRRLESLTSDYAVTYGPSWPAPAMPEAALGAIAGQIAAPAMPEAALGAIAGQIARERWPCVRLWFLTDSAAVTGLVTAFRGAGMAAAATAYNATWWSDVRDQNYDTYLARRPARLRNTIARRERRAARDGVTFTLATQADPDALAAYETVYAGSWKPAERSPEMIPALCAAAARHGALRLGVLWRGGDPLAAQIWLVSGATAVIYKLAHLPAGEPFSAGTLLTARMMAAVGFEPGVETVSFGYGDDGFKALWMDNRSPVQAVEAAPRLSLGAARLAAGRLKRRARVSK